jgi:hypothetical protein
VLEIRVRDLPVALDGMTILHVSDPHAGAGPGLAMLEQTVAWSDEVRPDLIALTGDLVTRRSGIPELQRVSAALAATARGGAYAVTGNHDHGDANDPFADDVTVEGLDGFDLIDGRGATLALRGRSLSIVGVAAGAPLAQRYRDVVAKVDEGADLRLLLCHFPSVLHRLPAGAFQLILAGHLHGGQICIPAPGGRIGLAHPGRRTHDGLFQREGTLMHVSPGLGTTFVPFRVLARPEATLLVLHPA